MNRLVDTNALSPGSVFSSFQPRIAVRADLASGSELLMRGSSDPTSTPWRAPIVEGYGSYAGASGWVRKTDLKNRERMTRVLLTP